MNRTTLRKPLLLLWSLLLVQTILYPQLATWVYRIATGREGWDGSALPFVQVVFAAPLALLLAILAELLCRFSVRRAKSVRLPLLGILALDLAVFVVSVAWYATRSGVR